jgi:enoyl-CoA hydratase/carnithine racemase
MNGWAIAAGWYIALECDIRIASEDAQMALREVEWGLPSPGVDSLPRQVPLGLALEILFTANPLRAQRAYEMGLVNQVVPPDQLVPVATTMAERICENAPLAIRATKQMVYKSLWPAIHEMKDVAQSLMAIAIESEDYLEGPRAFREKRKPQYQAR